MTRRRQVVWAALAVALIFAAGSAFAEGGFRRYFKLAQDVQQLKERNHFIVSENARLRREVESLRGEGRAVERAAREELGFVRPGEIVFSLESQ